jgi:hypothetical protein
MSRRPALQVSVRARAQPEPHLLRAAIAARLAGRPFATRVEDEIAQQVAGAVRGHARGGRPWR